MKTFENCAAQGDLLIRRIDKLPSDVKPVKDEKGAYIVAHSETGHHHVIAKQKGVEVFMGNDPLLAYLTVIDQTEVTLEHLRDFDKHESLTIKGGTYEIRRQREYTPEGWRRVAD
jgi:hypothetical protein